MSEEISPQTDPKTPTRRARARENGEGSLFQVKRGERIVWRAVETYGFDGQGKQIFVKGEGATKKIALDRLRTNRMKRQVADGLTPPEALALTPKQKAFTFSTFFEAWLPQQDIGEQSHAQYEVRYRLYLKPKFGATPLRLITAEEVVSFFKTELPTMLKANGELLSPTSVRGIYYVMSAALDSAFQLQKIVANPCRAMTPPKRAERSKERDRELARLSHWAPQQLIKHLEGHDDEARWILALFSLRASECLGLTDEAIKWGRGKKHEGAKLILHKQLARRVAKHSCGWDPVSRKWFCGKPSHLCTTGPVGDNGLYLKPAMKTKESNRDIPIVEPLYSALKRHMVRQEALRRSDVFDPLPGMETLVFTTKTGRPRKHQSDRRAWKELLDLAHVPNELRLHDARHLSLTMMLAMGVSSQELMRIAGWEERTLARMIATYTHTDTSFIQPAIKSLGVALMERRAREDDSPSS